MRHLMRAAALLLLLALPGRAEAHAVLLGTVPEDGAAHAAGAPPTAIELRFGEPVGILRLGLVGPVGRIDLRPAATVDGGTVRAPLPPGLGPGAYALDWRIRSTDAHPVAGLTAFTVGEVSAVPDRPAVAADVAGSLAGLVRAGALLLLLGAAGGVVFDRLVAPIPAPTGGRAAAMAGGLLTLAALGLKGASLLGEAPAAMLGPEVWTVAAASTAGRGAAALVLAAALLAARRRGLRLVGAAAAVLALPLTGHAAIDPQTAGALVLHGAAVAVWIGGLGPLAAVLARETPRRAARVVRRFSALALPAVIVLLAGGLALAAVQVGTIAAIGRDPYATVLATKVGLVVVLLAIATDNRLRRVPALRRDRPGAARGLRIAIGGEAALMVGIVGLTGVLATIPPPRVADAHAHAVVAPPPGRSVAVPFDGGLALVEVSPARPGANAATVRILDPAGAPRTVTGVRLALAPADGSTAEALRELAPAEGAWRGRVVLPTPGRWTVRIEVLVDDFTRLSARTVVDLR